MHLQLMLKIHILYEILNEYWVAAKFQLFFYVFLYTMRL